MAASESDQDPIEEDVRVSSLEERLEKAQRKERVKTERTSKGLDKNYRLGAKVLGDLIGGVAGGFIVGFALDYWLETKPLFLLLFLFIGIGVAFWNIYRISSPAKPKADADDKTNDQGLD